MTLKTFKSIVGDKYALLFSLDTEIITGRIVKYDKTVITSNEFEKLKQKLEIEGYILSQSTSGRVIISNLVLREERKTQKKLVSEFENIF